MEARPCQIIDFFNGTKQLLVPLFQRPYEWKKDNWQTFWDDLMDRYERSGSDSATHFTGAIVTAPARSVPVGVSKHLVIDGQQRLTTVAVLVCAIRNVVDRDSPRFRKLTRLLINEDDEGLDYYKILPTQLDRDAFFGLLKGQPESGTRICEAYEFFGQRLSVKDSEGTAIDIDRLVDALHTQITVVSIHLAEADDPYLIFESLNAKGAPLTQADLIRNYLLLRLHAQAQQDAYERFWVPMQRLLPSEHLTEFMRQYLMTSGEEVSRSEIYSVLKRRFSALPDSEIIDQLKDMHSFSALYACLVGLEREDDLQIDRALSRLRRLEMSVANPLLLKLLNARKAGAVDVAQVRTALAVVESYVVRRMVCKVPTNQMKRIFLGLTKDLSISDPVRYVVDSLSAGSAGRRWPKDDEFKDGWLSYRAYAAPLDRCRLILETLENDLGHKEPASFAAATIEHIMPQALSEEWKADLGVTAAADVHERWLDTIGNLTLTGYNSELSNEVFAKKKDLLQESHFEMNKAIAGYVSWNEDAIRERALYLFEQAKLLWERPS
jgi:uncharacterized protein with ParB-like and HNH nuclease domain